MKFYIGEHVLEGGIKGPESIITEFRDGLYTTVSLDGMAIGRISEDMLYKIPKKYVQLSLFGGLL